MINAQDITLTANASLNHDRTQVVPAGAPAGTYTYAAYAGDYQNWVVEDTDSFTFEKEGTDGINTKIDPSEWISYGESFENEIQFVKALSEYALLSSYPNPFNPETTLSWSLPQSGEVALIIFDIQGREVARLVDGYQLAGFHQIEFNAECLASGVYFAQLASKNGHMTQKLLLLK
ncbi:MAG: T9SS type A sorting domain-containing protein [Candidatus Marinimicrobia bacterium]|nr:T9SS type A sorting domain-containing protein [Candidatus Neomarinimicrobiota bacterium]